MAETCFHCSVPVGEDERLVLVRGKRYEVFCSESCLRTSIRRRRQAKAAARRRWFLRLSLPCFLLIGVVSLWKRHRSAPPHSISYAWPEGLPVADTPPAPVVIGPPWPPTDEQWTAVFDRVGWTYPLPGPIRRAQIVVGRIFGPEPPPEHPARCRVSDQCGIDLGGELWGEHVYAALDGVVDRVQSDGKDRGGGHCVRLSHLGGMVFTQYCHLAAIPRNLGRGVRVTAGDVIGLVGDTGLKGAHPLLHFALSIRPSSDLSEVYWDPTRWLIRAQLRMPPHGTVAGFAP
jgi:murein DD-endopeptidase MepM/ murein hydrolase activator NlpD